MSNQIAITSTAGILITTGITTLGAIVVAVFSNWDKIFHRDKVVTAKVETDYRPTGDFETEARIYFEVSGTRAQVADMQAQILDSQEKQLIAQSPEDEKLIATLMDVAQDSLPPLEEFLKLLIPIWHEHFTLEQIQELNKFYSTKPMQDMRSKNVYVMRDYLPQALAVVARYSKDLGRRMDECVEAYFAEKPGTLPA